MVDAAQDVISPSQVFCDVAVANKEEALHFLSEKGVALGISEDAEGLYESFVEREALGSTGCVEGLAIPHAKSDVVVRPAVCIVKFAWPLEWGSLDGKPVTCAVALYVPSSQAGDTHLKLLSKIAVLASRDDFGTFIAATNDPVSISDYMTSHWD